jgi:hypothetical protein
MLELGVIDDLLMTVKEWLGPLTSEMKAAMDQFANFVTLLRQES